MMFLQNVTFTCNETLVYYQAKLLTETNTVVWGRNNNGKILTGTGMSRLFIKKKKTGLSSRELKVNFSKYILYIPKALLLFAT